MTKRAADMIREAREQAGWRIVMESLVRQRACPAMDFSHSKGELDWRWIRYLHWQHLQEHSEIECACRDLNN